MTAPGGDVVARAYSATTDARPICLDSAVRFTPSADISASFTVSFAKSGNENSRASTGASVDVPPAGGPDTTT